MNDIFVTGVSRRATLLGAASIATAALARPHIARAAEPIRIGLLQAKQGPIVQQAEYLQQGAFLALEQMNNMLLGRPAEIVWEDEPSPQAAGQNAQRLIQEKKVVALVGGTLSSTALAEQAVAGQLKIPYMTNNAAASEITGKNCNRYSFRLQPPVPVHARAMLPYLTGIGKKWYFLTASYAFGQDIARSFRALLKEIGGTEVGGDDVPMGTSDFSSFVLKVRAAKPDLVIGGLTSGDLSNFLKQWDNFGMRDQVPFTEISIGDTDLWSIGPETVTGTFTTTWWYKDPNNSPSDRAFADAYMKKYNRPAADKAWMGWYSMRCMLQSIEAAKSTDPDEIVEAMENWSEQDGDNTVHFRKWDHQMQHRLLIQGAKKHITDKWDYLDVLASVPKTNAEMDKAFGAKSESACHMTPV